MPRARSSSGSAPPNSTLPTEDEAEIEDQDHGSIDSDNDKVVNSRFIAEDMYVSKVKSTSSLKKAKKVRVKAVSSNLQDEVSQLY